MTEEKLKLILKNMKGITYLEWKKLSHCIDTLFNADASAVTNSVPLADAERIVETYQKEFL